MSEEEQKQHPPANRPISVTYRTDATGNHQQTPAGTGWADVNAPEAALSNSLPFGGVYAHHPASIQDVT